MFIFLRSCDESVPIDIVKEKMWGERERERQTEIKRERERERGGCSIVVVQ